MAEVKEKILIVDDEPLNLKVLKIHLAAAGYAVLDASGGKDAVAVAVAEAPDLILLDIMMPVMDGFEVCRILKSDPLTAEIPVIYLSALHDTRNKVVGFETGGVDYICKPFEAGELLARVRLHLTIRRQEMEIRNYMQKLEEMVEERTRQLVHADRLATLGTFASAVVHEINNPVTYISGNAELVKMFMVSARPILERNSGEDETGLLGKMIDRVDGMLDSIMDGSRRIQKMVAGLKGYARQGEERKACCRLADCVVDAVNLVGHRFKLGISIQVDVSKDIQILCDSQKISQVIVNLLNNSIDAMEGRRGKIVVKAATELDEAVVLTVRDEGPGISDETAEKIFDPFFTTKPKEKGTGLGLFIIKSIVNEHGGDIWLMPHDGNGAEFRIRMPGAPETACRV